MKKLGMTGLTLALLLTACGEDVAVEDTEETVDESVQEDTETETGPVTMTDGMGREVEIPEDPENIIASYLEDYLVALNVTPAAQWSISDGAGVQNYLQDELGDVPTIPYDLPYESVLEFSPDLLILRDQPEEDMVSQYSEIAPTYVLESQPTNWRGTLLEVGEVLGEEEKAEEVIDAYDQKAADTSELVSENAEGESAAAIWMVDTSLFVVHPERSSGAVLYGDAGFEVPEVVSELSGDADWAAVSLEELAQMDVDRLFFISDNGDEALSEDRLWQNIPAVENDQVHVFASDSAWLYYGPTANEQVLGHIEDSLTND